MQVPNGHYHEIAKILILHVIIISNTRGYICGANCIIAQKPNFLAWAHPAALSHGPATLKSGMLYPLQSLTMGRM